MHTYPQAIQKCARGTYLEPARVGIAFHARHDRVPMEMHPGIHQTGFDLADALAVKAAQQHGSHHDRGVKAQLGQEASAFKRNVAGTGTQRLARGMVQCENVVRCDAKLTGTRCLLFGRVLGTATDGNQKGFGSRRHHLGGGLAGVQCVLHSMWIHERGICIDVRHVLFPQRLLVAKVEGKNVIVHILRQLFPVVRHISGGACLDTIQTTSSEPCQGKVWARVRTLWGTYQS
jgi:hypothetical protein